MVPYIWRPHLVFTRIVLEGIMDVILALIAIGGAGALATSLRILREYERAVVFRLGRARPIRGRCWKN